MKKIFGKSNAEPKAKEQHAPLGGKPARRISPEREPIHAPRIQRGIFFGILVVVSLMAFEAFNFSTTEYALKDLLGEFSFAGFAWATILAVAFCAIDFAGIARLFTPSEKGAAPAEVWYLFGAWMLAATMNAMLTWWGVSVAIISHQSQGTAFVPLETQMRVVPIFVAIMVWLIRVLIIGSFSLAGEHLFQVGESPAYRPAMPSRADRSRQAATPDGGSIADRKHPRPVTSSPEKEPAMGLDRRTITIGGNGDEGE